MTGTEPPAARVVIVASALGKGIAGGLTVIVPVAVLVAIGERALDDFHSSGLAVIGAVLLLFGFATSGYGAARYAPDAPLSHGLLGGVGAFAAWLLLTVVDALLPGADTKIRFAALLSRAVLAAALGLFGGWFADRKGPRPA